MKSITKIFISIAALAVVFGFFSFNTEPVELPFAPEYAVAFGGSFPTFVFGCTDASATNYNPDATHNNGSCKYPPKPGCTDIFASNYDHSADVNDGSCVYPTPDVKTCKMTASAETINYNSNVTLTWETEGYTDFKINGVPVSGASGSKTYTNVTENTTYTLIATDSKGHTCKATVYVKCLPVPELPKCDYFTASPTTLPHGGGNVTLKWETTNATNVSISGVGNVALDNTAGRVVPVSNTTTFVLTATNAQGHDKSCVQTVTVEPAKPLPKCDYFTASPTTLPHGGGNVTLKWETTNATNVSISGVGNVALDNTAGRVVPVSNTTTFVLTATNAQGHDKSCVQTVTVEPAKPLPKCDYFTASPTTLPHGGGNVTLKWETTNATNVSISGVGNVALDNTAGRVVPVSNTTTFVLTATNAQGHDKSCVQTVTVEPAKPLPKCDYFTASPSAITVGSTTTLQWGSTNATQAFINNAVGAVPVDGSIEVAPLVSTTYVLTLIGAEDKTVNCAVPVTVSADPVPVCKYFTATPNSLPVGGGSVLLDWEVEKATVVSIAPTLGTVALKGSRTVNITEGVTYVLTATDSNGDTVKCSAPVAVADPSPVFTCANNVTFTASPSTIRRGSSVTLDWSTTGVDTVFVSGINATALSGSQSVSPSSDTAYTLTATQGSKTINCPVSVSVTTGGGGGSSSPRCDLDISDTKISRGEEITLTWDTSRATEVTLTDDRGNVLFTTDDYLSKDKSDYYDGSITVKPTRDTKYTLLAERGSRDRECEVEVEVEDDIVVLQTRDQKPLVAGISLTQVPYTGFEAGPLMTLFFYALLVAWSLFITYLLVIRNRVPATATPAFSKEIFGTSKASMKQAESVRPDAFAPSVMTKVASSQATPTNLPTGIPVAGQDVMNTAAPTAQQPVSDTMVTALENRAHSQKALLSSDAVRYFVATTEGSVERNEALDQVIAEAKKTYPLEDGWIVVNEARMRSVCDVCKVNEKEVAATATAPAITTVPDGAGSLAEAIVTGNVVAAYELIGHRPMFALADAAADLDAVYRNRKGERHSVSDLLTAETKKFSDAQISDMIAALTGALDGTYADEASAVKMAIMKAVKVAA